MANVVLHQAFENELIKGFDNLNEDFLGMVPDRSSLVGNNALNTTEIGADPAVLIDNTVYPLNAAQREDNGAIIPLRKMETEVTIITEDELYALPYDKKGSVIDQHKNALRRTALEIALHSFAPAGNTADTPILLTSGDIRDGRRMLTPRDLILFREKLDNMGVPQAGTVLVLCPEHVADMLLFNQAFEKQYHDIKAGKIMDMYGFSIYTNQYKVRYNKDTGVKAAFGSEILADHRNASVAFYAPNAIKARGSVEMFYAEARNNPRYKQNEVSFTMHFLSIPKKVVGFGALLSQDGEAGN